MVDMYENCTCKCLNYYSVFIPATIAKPCFSNTGAYVVTPFKIIINVYHTVKNIGGKKLWQIW